MCVSHIFATNSKKGLEPKGLEFIRETRAKFSCEIYALGGIDSQNFKKCLEAGASKVCVMSSAMMANSEASFVKKFVV